MIDRDTVIELARRAGFQEGTMFIEIREIYDGWSVAQLPTGELINLWERTDRRYPATARWIAEQEKEPQ